MSFDLRAWREWIGWSQRELATLCDVTVATISELERGRAMVRGSTLQRLARALGVPRSVLLHETPVEAWARGWRPPEHDALLMPDGARDHDKPSE
jgi:transcriptional regulator with XRE-family HTH domain